MKAKSNKHVGVKMPADLNNRLEQLAQGENNSLSSVVRRILTDGVHREEARVSHRREDGNEAA